MSQKEPPTAAPTLTSVNQKEPPAAASTSGEEEEELPEELIAEEEEEQQQQPRFETESQQETIKTEPPASRDLRLTIRARVIRPGSASSEREDKETEKREGAASTGNGCMIFFSSLSSLCSSFTTAVVQHEGEVADSEEDGQGGDTALEESDAPSNFTEGEERAASSGTGLAANATAQSIGQRVLLSFIPRVLPPLKFSQMLGALISSDRRHYNQVRFFTQKKKSYSKYFFLIRAGAGSGGRGGTSREKTDRDR